MRLGERPFLCPSIDSFGKHSNSTVHSFMPVWNALNVSDTARNKCMELENLIVLLGTSRLALRTSCESLVGGSLVGGSYSETEVIDNDSFVRWLICSPKSVDTRVEVLVKIFKICMQLHCSTSVQLDKAGPSDRVGRILSLNFLLTTVLHRHNT